jgi:hypothetical protein
MAGVEDFPRDRLRLSIGAQPLESDFFEKVMRV